MRRRFWLALASVILVVVGIEVYIWRVGSQTATPPPQFNPLEYFPHLQPGEQVPSFEAETPDGGSERIDYEDGEEKTLLFAFSVTCGTCMKTIPYWNRIAREVGSEVRVYGLLVEHRGAVHAVRAEQKLLDGDELQFPVLRFRDEGSYEDYKITKVPQTILVGSGGEVETVLMGELSDSQLDEILARVHVRTHEAESEAEEEAS
jgi:hypothetical protein